MKPETLFAALAVLLAAGALAYPVYTAREDRNAALVQIGVSVLRADPSKESQVNSAREWALDLIDANAGGVKFTKQAREALLRGALPGTPLPSSPCHSAQLSNGHWVVVCD